MQDGLENVTGAIAFHFYQLRHSTHILILVITHDRKVISEYTRKVSKNPAFDVSIIQHICDIGCNLHRKLQIPGFQLYILPEVTFVGGIPGRFQIRGCRVPFEFSQVIHVGLLDQKIRIQHMTQFVREQT